MWAPADLTQKLILFLLLDIFCLVISAQQSTPNQNCFKKLPFNWLMILQFNASIMAQWADSFGLGWTHSGSFCQLCVDKAALLVLEGHSHVFSGWVVTGCFEIALTAAASVSSMPPLTCLQNTDMFVLPWPGSGRVQILDHKTCWDLGS